MALVKFWLGSVGPLMYDDTDVYVTEVGDLVEGLANMTLAGEKILVMEMDVEDLMGPDGNRILKFLANATGVNYFTMRAGSGGSGPTLAMGGESTMLPITIASRLNIVKTVVDATTVYNLVDIALTDTTHPSTVRGLNVDMTGVTAGGGGNVTAFRTRGADIDMGGDASWIFYMYTFADAASSSIRGRRARGTEAAPTAIKSGDLLFSVRGNAHYSATSQSEGVRMSYEATEDWSGTNKGTKVVFRVIPTGSVTLTEILDIYGDKVYSTQNYDVAAGKTYNINGASLFDTLVSHNDDIMLMDDNPITLP